MASLDYSGTSLVAISSLKGSENWYNGNLTGDLETAACMREKKDPSASKVKS